MSQPKLSTKPIMAGAPYLDDDADIVLQSSDGVHFRVHKLLLSKCSPVFSDLFSLPQPKAWGKDSAEGERPVVQMAEDQHALRLLLGFSYPVGAAPFRTLSDIRIALDLTKKYQMSGTRECLKSLLLGHVHSEPERVLAIAWIFEMKDVAVAAAKQTLEMPWLEGPAPIEFNYVPAAAIHTLLRYQRACRTAALAVVSNGHTWFDKADRIQHSVLGDHIYRDRCSCEIHHEGSQYIRRWVVDFKGHARSALKGKSIGAVVRAPSIQLATITEVPSSDCNKCPSQMKEIALALEYVTDRLAAAVDAKVDTVKFETPF